MSELARYTLLICTCDAYADAWPPLFTLFRKYWPGLDAPIVLNTETRAFEFPGYDIHCPQNYTRAIPIQLPHPGRDGCGRR